MPFIQGHANYAAKLHFALTPMVTRCSVLEALVSEASQASAHPTSGLLGAARLRQVADDCCCAAEGAERAGCSAQVGVAMLHSSAA
jgi:hypothetical protein